jgi:hypothetical protein
LADTDHITAIAARRADIDERITHLREQIASLEVRRGELEIAERVLREIAGTNPATEYVSSRAPAHRPFVGAVPSEQRPRRIVSPKPPGLPSIPKMIIEALEYARDNGLRGFEPNEVLQFIKKKYWPEASSAYVGPTMWKMWKTENKLEREETLYLLPGAKNVDITPPDYLGQPDVFLQELELPVADQQRSMRLRLLNQLDKAA